MRRRKRFLSTRRRTRKKRTTAGDDNVFGVRQLAAAASRGCESGGKPPHSNSVQIKQQHFGIAPAQRDRALVFDRRSIAGVKRLSVDLHRSARDLEPRISA